MTELRTPRIADALDHSPEPTRPFIAVLSGERARRVEIEKRISYLSAIDHLRLQGDTTYSWERLLSGEIPEVSAGGAHPQSKLCIARAGARVAKSVLSFGGAVDTGVDYKALATSLPTQRYKFYHSFRDQSRANEYLTAIIKQSHLTGLSLNMKSFDHAYDGINLYTHHYSQLLSIINSTYPNFADAFLETEHFLQGSVASVNPRHIGWVQEPVAGLGHRSHSERMRQVGRALDAGGLDETAYLQGCADARVRPETPWLLTAEYEQELQAKAATLHR